MNAVRLTNWAIVPVGETRRLTGVCEGHPTKADGKGIQSSPITHTQGRYIFTENTLYFLEGEPNPDYVQMLLATGLEYDPGNPAAVRYA